MKYLLYRSFGNLDKDIKKHELVAVEYGKDIYEVTDALIKAAADDLAGMPEYEKFETAAFDEGFPQGQAVCLRDDRYCLSHPCGQEHPH